MSLAICPRCQKPRLAKAERCPHCGRAERRTFPLPEEESVAHAGCLIVLLLFALALFVVPLLLMAGILFR